MGASISATTRPTVGSDFNSNSVKVTHSGQEAVSFELNGHNVTLDKESVQFFINFKAVLQGKRALQEQFIKAAPTEAKLQQQLAQLKNIDRGKLSAQQLQQLDKDIASVEKALEDIGVDITLNQISQKPQDRENITKQFDRNAAKAAALSATLARVITQLVNTGLIQPQTSTDGFNSTTSSTPSQQKPQATRGDNKEAQKIAQKRNDASANTIDSLKADNKDAKMHKDNVDLQNLYAKNRSEETKGA
ncbi:MAG: hypothetical protein K2W99_02475 [Chthoniobacterales bacterium]|nr:hypothetical protein [Chthoniobacterales bacterium]